MRINEKADERGDIEKKAYPRPFYSINCPFKNAENKQDDNSYLHNQISFGFKCCPSLDVISIPDKA